MDRKEIKTSERRFAENGSYVGVYFFDKNGKPCEKKDAASMTLWEFDKDGNQINHIIGIPNQIR